MPDPDPYAPTGPFEPVGAPSSPPPEPRWKRRRSALRGALPTWLGVLAIAFVLGAAVSLTLVASPSARHAAVRAVRLVHHSPVTKDATLSEQARRLLPPAAVVRPASAAPVVSLSPPPSPSKPKVTPSPKPASATPKPVRTTPKPAPTPSPTTASPSPTPTPTPDLSPTLVTTSASTPHPHPHVTVTVTVTPPHTTPPPASPPPSSPPVTTPAPGPAPTVSTS